MEQKLEVNLPTEDAQREEDLRHNLENHSTGNRMIHQRGEAIAAELKAKENQP
jgi:hypothetical protein